jgi:very-short-patch-repair endonuclease
MPRLSARLGTDGIDAGVASGPATWQTATSIVLFGYCVAQSPIEKAFQSACRKAGVAVEAEQMVGRFRPDFIVRDRRLAIELDGHDTHASVEHRTQDAIRQRYLQRLGWTVMRFTGREVHNDADACVAEVEDFLLRSSVADPTFAIYIDWLFFQREVVKFGNRNRAHGNPDAISRDSFLKLLSGVVDMPAVVAVHLFGTASTFSQSACALETTRVFVDDGTTFLIEEHQAGFAAVELLDHLKAHREVYADRVVLVGDDGVYPPEFGDNDPRLAALIRLDKARSRMLTISPTKWMDIDHAFAAIAGVPLHELS